MRKMRIRPVFLVLLVFLDIPATRLGDLAATVEPGAFLRVSFTDLTRELFRTHEGNYILEYSQNMAWDPAQKRLFFIGAHVEEPGKFVQYDADADAWSEAALPPALSRAYLDRTYDHLALDPSRSRLYYRVTGTSQFHRFQCSTGAWTQLPSNSLMTYIPCCGALEYFPEMDALVFLNGGETRATGSLYCLPSDSASWRLACDTLRLPDIGSFLVYNPVLHDMWMGGRYVFETYLLGPGGEIRPGARGPHVFDPLVSNFTVDPVSGEFLILDFSTQMHTYDAQADHWDSLVPPIPGIHNIEKMKRILSAPLPEYGVVAYVFGDTAGPEFYLYRHAPVISAEKGSPGAAGTGIIISPNPASDFMRLSLRVDGLSGSPRADIFDVSGRLCFSLRLDRVRGGEYAADCRVGQKRLASGLYVARVRAGKKLISGHFLHLP